jgi:uracil-DNA glycosylase
VDDPSGVVDALAAAAIGSTFNFYRDGERAPLLRRRLLEYLGARAGAPFLLVGEAPGQRGARVSGLPFTSERQLTGAGPAEATATIVQGALADLGIAADVLLWNLVPTHPHAPGRPGSNRPPTHGEIAAARPFVDALATGRQLLAVGRLAARELRCEAVRHPSHGGAAAFRSGLAEALGT